jgi:ATP-dependent DNA helicase RecG
MRTLPEIIALLDALEHEKADNLEDQDLDFKQWDRHSRDEAISTVIEYAVCMANGGGGTVVFGVHDKIIGRKKAILGVPLYVDPNILKKLVYDATDPKITPVFEEIIVPEGTGRILVMHVFGGMAPYSDTGGSAKIRIGNDCKPLTGSMRRKVMVETGESDYTAELIPGRMEEHLSPTAVEAVRKWAAKVKAPEDLLKLTDSDLASSLGLTKGNQIVRAGLMLFGKESSIKEHARHYRWTHLRMKDDTEYTDRMDGGDAFLIAIDRIFDRIMADNPLTTVIHGMFHFEYRRYPEIVLREALMNAFCHADFRIESPILIKQFQDRIEMSNPGELIGGITPENILRHGPVARNPMLVGALTQLRLVNRSNLGVPRMYKEMLIEGKEPPIIDETGEAVKVTLNAGEFSPAFRAFVENEGKSGKGLTIDHLLILRYLASHREIDTKKATFIIQRNERQALDILHEMEHDRHFLEHGGTGRSTYWALSPALHRLLNLSGHPDGDKRMDWEAAKATVLSVLRKRRGAADNALMNEDIRKITHLDRFQVSRLMKEMRGEHSEIQLDGAGRGSKYLYQEKRKKA